MDSDRETYLVPGATGGIGSELCRHLTKEGVNPVLSTLRPPVRRVAKA